MAIDRKRARECLNSFDFRRLFIDQLGWNKCTHSLEKVVDGRGFRFQAVSEKHGVVVLVSDSIPDYTTRAKLDKLIATAERLAGTDAGGAAAPSGSPAA